MKRSIQINYMIQEAHDPRDSSLFTNTTTDQRDIPYMHVPRPK